MFFSLCKRSSVFLKPSVQRINYSHALKSDFIRTSIEDNIYLIGINRPEKRNCVNHETAMHLKEAFLSFSRDQDAYVAILYGVGGTFCAGYDLEEVSKGLNSNHDFSNGPMGPTKMSLRKPVIAAIDGHAVAGGMELALWCDIRIMEETAYLGVLCRRFGVPLIDGGTVRLPKLIGLARALDLILTGRKVSASEAFDIGLVSKLCKEGEALKSAMELGKQMCEQSQETLRDNLSMMYKTCYVSDSFDKS